MRPGVGCICRALARREGRPRASRTWANRKPRANTWSEGQMASPDEKVGLSFPAYLADTCGMNEPFEYHGRFYERPAWDKYPSTLEARLPWLNPNHPEYDFYKNPKNFVDSGSTNDPDDELSDAAAAAKYGTSRRTKRKRKPPKTESDYPTAKVQRALMVSDFISKHSLHAHYEDSWPMEDIEILAKALHPGQSQAKSQTMNALRASAKPPVSMTNVAVMAMVRAFINKHSLHHMDRAGWSKRATTRFANLLFREHRECFKVACTDPLPGTLRWLARICWGRSSATGPSSRNYYFKGPSWLKQAPVTKRSIEVGQPTLIDVASQLVADTDRCSSPGNWISCSWKK